MAFDPSALIPLIGGLHPKGGGAFMRGFARAQQEIQQRQFQQQQVERQERLDVQGAERETRIGDQQQQQLMLQADTGARAREQQRMAYTQQLQRLFTDESVDPDVAMQLATMSPPEGYDVGAIESMASKVFTPSERQRRAAAARLKDIEADPQIKKLLEAGEDLSTVAFTVPKLGANPNDPDGKPLWTRGELLQLAQRPVASTPLPKVTPASQQPNTTEEAHIADAIALAAEAKGQPLTRAETSQARLKAVEEYARIRGRADDRPGDPQLAEINWQLAQGRLDAQRTAAASAPALPPAVQRRVDMKTRAFDQQPVVKRIQTIAEAVTFVEGMNPNTDNPQDDQALIYAFAKAMDPESVVREGEYATVQKYAQSWIESFGFNAQRVLSNSEFLTPQARKNLKATIRARFNAAKPQYENIRKSYVKQINGITQSGDGDTYLIDYAAGFPPAPGGGGGTAGASYQDYLNSRPR